MVTVKIESREQAEFLQMAFKYAQSITSCDAGDITMIKQLSASLSEENQTLKLTGKQVETFKTVMQLYTKLSADFVTWSDDFLKQMPVKAKDAPAFYEMLRDYHLEMFAKDALTLFKYFITQDWGYFNAELLDLIEQTRNLDWIGVGHWCRSRVLCNDTTTKDEVTYYIMEYCQ